jgi:uncharacterized Tic20 family protein
MNPNNKYFDEDSAEKSSNVYLMSLIGVMAGLPLPILNLLATIIFFVGNKKAQPIVRWHCIQGMLSQFVLFIFNSISFWWTISIIFYKEEISNNYLSYLLFVIILNVLELISTIYTAIKVRKGQHVEWWFYGPLTNLLLKL